MTKIKAGIITMGCPKNIVDSEKLAGYLQASGVTVCHECNEAEVIVINTCGFINDAKEESIQEILKQISRKQTDKTLKVIVTGCLSQRYKQQLAAEIPEVDMFFGTSEYDRVAEMISGKKEFLQADRVLSTPSHFAYLKISEGCSRSCSFCAIPFIRGPHVSIPEETLLSEARKLSDAGVKELIVIAQDTVSYGLDLYGERRIASLLRKISEIDGIEWIRLMYTYPAGFTDELIDEIAQNHKIVKYIDLPLQHSCSEVLKSMKRGVNSDDTARLITKLREKIPGLAIRTAFIVGYPGETSAQFTELKNFVKSMRFERFGVFAYSEEEGTEAATLIDNVAHEIKMKRMSELLRIHEKISMKLNEDLIGKIIDVIIDEYSDEENVFYGRTAHDAPEIDNVVRIFADKNKVSAGHIIKVRISGAGLFDLEAEQIHS